MKNIILCAECGKYYASFDTSKCPYCSYTNTSLSKPDEETDDSAAKSEIPEQGSSGLFHKSVIPFDFSPPPLYGPPQFLKKNYNAIILALSGSLKGKFFLIGESVDIKLYDENTYTNIYVIYKSLEKCSFIRSVTVKGAETYINGSTKADTLTCLRHGDIFENGKNRFIYIEYNEIAITL